MWPIGARSGRKQKERRKAERRAFPHYMPLMNEQTGELVGHMVDISSTGFRMESLRPIRIDTDLPLRIEVPPDIGVVPFMVFRARSRWSLPDRVDPTLYDVGCQIVDMRPEDGHVFGIIFDKYGTAGPAPATNGDYLWGHEA